MVHRSQTLEAKSSRIVRPDKMSDKNVRPTRMDTKRADMDIKHMYATRIPLSRMYDYHRKFPHWQKADTALFVTFRRNGRDQFRPDARDAVLHCCLKGNNYKFTLHAVVVMPEHVHMLLTPMNDPNGWPYGLPDILKSLKGASARAVNKVLGASGPVWQEESFDHVLRSEDSLEEKREYIRQNPVRRGLVKRPEDYPWLWVEK